MGFVGNCTRGASGCDGVLPSLMLALLPMVWSTVFKSLPRPVMLWSARRARRALLAMAWSRGFARRAAAVKTRSAVFLMFAMAVIVLSVSPDTMMFARAVSVWSTALLTRARESTALAAGLERSEGQTAQLTSHS